MRSLSFEEIFDKYVVPEPMSGCWLWTGHINTYGYGYVTHKNRPAMATHIVWALYKKGIVPKGICLCHVCDNRICVNPDHLFLGTKGDNNKDRDRKLRQAHGIRQWKAKLNPEIVKTIRASSSSCSELGIQYGVNKTTISLIKRRKSWKHVI